MPDYINLPDGTRFEVLPGETPAAAFQAAAQKYPEAFGIQQQRGFIPAVKAGAKEGVGAGIRGVGSMIGATGMEQYGAQMMEPSTEPGAYHPYTPEEEAAKYKEGLLPGIGASFRRHVSEPAGGMVGRYALPTAAGAAAAALAPAGGAFGLGAAGTAALARGAGFIAADMPSEMGENIQRQQEVAVQRQAAGQAPIQQNTPENVLTSLAQAALMPVFGALGGAGMKYFKLMGPDLATTTKAVMTGQMTQAEAVNTLNSTAKNMLARTGEAAAVGAPMMVGTEALRRSAAGQDVTGGEAQEAYGEQLKAAAAFAPIGGLMGVAARRPQVKAVERAGAEFGRAEEMDAAIKAEQAQKEAAFQATPEGQTQEMGFAPAAGISPDVAREQAVLQYMQEQKMPASAITAQKNAIKELQQAGGVAVEPVEAGVPVADSGFFNAAGLANKGVGKKIREEYQGTPLTDPAKVEALHDALTEHANSKQAPSGEAMRKLTSAIEDLNLVILRNKFDEANKIYTETGNEAPLREVLAKAKEQPGYHAPLFPEEAAPREVTAAPKKPARAIEPVAVEPARAVEPVKLEERVEPVKETIPEMGAIAPEMGAIAPEREIPVVEKPAPKERGKRVDISEEAFVDKTKSEWEKERDASADYPAYEHLHPDAKDLLHARIEQRAVDREGNRDPSKIEVTGEDMRAARAKHRDAVRSQEIQAEVGRRDPDEFMYRAGEAHAPQEHTKAEAQAMVENIKSKWTNAPDVQVKEFSELTPEEQGWAKNAQGFINKNTKAITVLSDRHANLAEVKATLFHEALGHFGLRSKFRADLNRMLGDMYDTNKDLRTMAEAHRKDAPGMTKEAAMEEVLAESQIGGKVPQKLLNRAVALVRSYLRKLGLVRGYSMNDAIAVLRKAHAEVTQGKSGEPISGEAAARTKEAPSVESAQEFVRNVVGPTGEKIVADTSHVLKKAAGYLTYLHDLVAQVEGKLPSAKDWYQGLLDIQKTKFKLERNAEDVAARADSLNETSRNRTNDFLGESTYEQKWGYQPTWLKRAVTVDPVFKDRWENKLSTEEKAVADSIFKYGEELRTYKDDMYKRLGISDVFAQLSRIEGPYAPLRRFGKFVAVLKSAELERATKAFEADNTPANAARVEALKQDPKHFTVSRFDTPGQAEQFAKTNAHKYAFTDHFAESTRTDDKSTMNYKVLERVMEATKADPNLPAPARKAMEDTVRGMYMSAVNQYEARQAGMRRKNRAGYDPDMIRSFLSEARAQAAFTANLEHGREVNNAFYKMQGEVKSPEGKRVSQDEYNMLAQHYAENLTYDPSPVQDRIVGLTSAWQLSTSLGYHLANFSQGMMVTVPRLGADFNNYSGAWSHLMNGYKTMRGITTGMKTDLNKITDTPLRKALQNAADHGLIDVGIEEDLSHMDRFRTGYKAIDGAGAVANRALHKLRQVSRAVETWNRVSSGTAAYKMAIEHGRTPEQASTYMMDVLRTTQGDFSRTGAPLLLKKLPKVMTQYRKYQLMMMAFYAKAYTAAFHGATAEEKAIGKRMLAYKLFHTSVASGALGLPLMNLASLAYGMVGGGPDDLEASLKHAIGNDDLSAMLLHGPLALSGIDLSAKISDDKTFSIAPYTKFDLTSAAGAMQTVGGIAGGPAVGQLGRMASGVGLMQQGDTYKGVERLLPKGFESTMQAFRLANEGVTLKNGDVAVKPEDISAYALALQAVGLPAAQIKEITRNQNVQYQVTKYYSDKTKELERSYLRAFKDKDQEAMADLRKQWMELQKSKRAERVHYANAPDALKEQPLSNMLKYPSLVQARERREQRAMPST